MNAGAPAAKLSDHMNALEKWKWLCGGSRLLALLTLGEAGVWIAVTALALLGNTFHFHAPIAEWLTLPSSGALALERPWTLLTYMAVQFDFFHMLFNVAWLYWFGRFLLLSLPERWLGLYFAGGGLFGGIFFLAASAMGMGGGWLCGCSAAVIAVVAGAAIRMPDYPVRLFLLGEVRLKWVALVCCLLTFLGGGSNQAAHLGGLAWGAAIAFALQRGWITENFRISFNKGRSDSGGRTRRADRMVKALKERQTDMQRLDALLDKIRLSGYGALTLRERKELNELSRKMKKPE